MSNPYSLIFGKKQTFWSDGCFAASIGEVSSKTIEYYIAKSQSHQLSWWFEFGRPLGSYYLSA